MRTLFLDRDGVINVLIEGDYVRQPDEFVFLPRVLDALAILARHFDRIFVVTNQQGIGKGLMTEDDLGAIHKKLFDAVNAAGGRIDRIYHCPHRKEEHSPLRKPNIGMALQARHDYPEIRLKDAVMVGDSLTDMLFGQRCHCTNILVGRHPEIARNAPALVDFYYESLWHYAQSLDNRHSTTA